MDVKVRGVKERRSGGGGSTSATWQEFERRLAQALQGLEVDQFLVIPVKRSRLFLQFASRGTLGLRAETTGNGYLDGSERLGDAQVAALETLGWSPPTREPDQAPDRQPDGSPNFHRDFPGPTPFDEVAHLAVRTFADVLGVPHPRFLEYRAFHASGRGVPLPALGLDASPGRRRNATPTSSPAAGVRQAVLALVRRVTGNARIDFDEDGAVPLAIGNVAGLVTVDRWPAFVRVSCLLLDHVDASEALMRRLHELNARIALGRLVLTSGAIFASVDLFPSQVVADQVIEAFAVLNAIGGTVAGELRAEFGTQAGPGSAPASSLKN